MGSIYCIELGKIETYTGGDLEQFNLLDSAEKEYLAAVKSCMEERGICELENNKKDLPIWGGLFQ